MRSFLTLLVTVFLTTSLAQREVVLEHTEKVQVGPYQLTVGFSRWPVQADRSLDFVFIPEGGLADKTATITFIAPSKTQHDFTDYHYPLPRFARDPTMWGFDVMSLPEEGQWTFKIAIDGSQGRSEGSLDVVLLPRPAFLPRIVNWTLGLLPFMALIVLLVVMWFRVKPGKCSDTWTWQDNVPTAKSL